MIDMHVLKLFYIVGCLVTLGVILAVLTVKPDALNKPSLKILATLMILLSWIGYGLVIFCARMARDG